MLAAEPLYLLFDTAVIGRLGALSLAGLAVGGLVVAMVSTQLTFLSYGTTARSARFHGAGGRTAAVHEGVQATWLAVGLELLMVVVVQVMARPLVSAIAGDSVFTSKRQPHRRATARRARHHRRRVDNNNHLSGVVTELLGQRWSPQQISRHLRLRFAEDPSMWLCHESIYQAVYQPNSRFLRPSRLAPHRRSPLRSGRDHRRAHQCQQRRRPRFQQPMLTIHDRPFSAFDRSQAGHWEGDFIIGNNHLSAIGTLVERQTRMLRLVHLPRADSDSLHAALVARMRDLPPGLMRSITWDQGTEMARHLATAAKLGAPVYFCDSRSPWQRGSSENTNGLLRDYFPKGVTLINHPPEHLSAVERELNHRPRMVLHDRCPADLFAALLTSNSPSVLRR